MSESGELTRRKFRTAVTAGNGGAISRVFAGERMQSPLCSAARQPMVRSVLLSSAAPTKPVR
jgi:hypothetical protein